MPTSPAYRTGVSSSGPAYAGNASPVGEDDAPSCPPAEETKTAGQEETKTDGQGEAKKNDN